MIGKQLDLFGGAPMPPKKIRVEDDAVPDIFEEHASETDEIRHEDVPPSDVEKTVDTEMMVQSPVSEVFVQMPANHANDTFILTTSEEELPDWVNESEESPLDGALFLENDVPNTQQPESTEEKEEATQQDLVEDEVIETLQQQVVGLEQMTETMVPVVESEQENWEQEEIIIPTDGRIDEAGIGGKDRLDMQEPEMEWQPVNEAFIKEAASPELPDETNHIEDRDGTDSQAKGLNIPADSALYSRQYYTMRETAAMFNVNQSLLRYWENEFDILKPKKNRKGDRYFRPEDIKNLELIYHLLRVRKFTIEGAKDYVKSKAKSMQTFEMVQRLEKLKHFLLDFKSSI